MVRKSGPADDVAKQPVTEAQVLAYLRANPSFLAKNVELLSRLAPPSRFDGDSVVDMQHYMIERLNEELDQMRGCAEHLITTSRSNMSVQNRTHEAVLAVLAAGGMEALARAVGEDFPTLLDIDVATLGFETGGPVMPIVQGLSTLPEGLVDRLLGAGDVMLRSAAQADPLVFGPSAGLVKSFALVRLAPEGAPSGLLALGSRKERTFTAAQGTDLLAFIGNVIEDGVKRWWPAG